jgi:hypothetical protein
MGEGAETETGSGNGDAFVPVSALSFRKAVADRTTGQPAEAELGWRRILTLRRPEQFCSVDQGTYGHLIFRNLAALAAERGDHAEAQRLCRAVLAECPGDPEALAKLTACAAGRDPPPAGASEVGEPSSTGYPVPGGLQRSAHMRFWVKRRADDQQPWPESGLEQGDQRPEPLLRFP